jgi:hypothetical protein
MTDHIYCHHCRDFGPKLLAFVRDDGHGFVTHVYDCACGAVIEVPQENEHAKRRTGGAR